VVVVLAVSTVLFLALAPFARLQLPVAHWFIPLVQSVLIVNDLVTAALLVGQLRLAGRPELLVLAGGYLYAAVMAGIHLLTFPDVFTHGGLLGAGAQTTGYLHVFWHVGLPCAIIAFVALRRRRRRLAMPPGRAVALMIGVVAVLALALTLFTTRGNDLLPPMLAGTHYSSAFNIGRYGQWALTAAAILVLWRSRRRSVLDLWLIVMLCNSFFEIALVSIFNAGRYDLGFYAGRVYAVLSSCVVLVMLLGEHGKLHRELALARQTAQSEAALRDSREALRLAMQSGRMAAWTRDLAGAKTWWSPEVEQLTGWPAAALGADDGFFLQRVHPDDREAVRQALEPAQLPQQDVALEFRVRHADGGWRWLDCRGRLQDDPGEGESAHLFGVLVDITERRDSEQAVARILESITDGFFAVDAEWRFTYVNREAERLLQRSRAELLGRNLWAEFPEALGSAFQREYERAQVEQRTASFEEYYPQLGIWVEVRAFPNAGGLSVYFHDVTARRKAQEELRQSEESYRVLADMIPQHIWVTEGNGYHYYFSRSWYEYTGTAPGESDGENWLAMLHPDDREHTLRAWHHSLATGEPYRVEYRFRGADGQYRWFIGQAAPLRSSEGRIVRWFGTLTDISERKENEAERERLLASEREARAEADRRRAQLERVTESRARLMRGFSHDLRSPLAAADMSAALLEDGRAFGPLADRQRESVRRIRRGIRTSLHLIDDLLELARAEAGQIDLERTVVDVGEVAHEIAEEFQAQAASVGLELEVRVPNGVLAEADRMRTRQIIANLVSNAIKYAPRGRATIQADPASTGEGGRIAVSVVDTGPGIPEDKRELIFEEYTRLDPGAQQGSGIGLAISRRIARLMGGELTMDSELGRGCIFTLWLPAPSPAPGPRRPEASADPARAVAHS
jgi:PAS domain S-box-containing protein